jgi:hypothetical protein
MFSSQSKLYNVVKKKPESKKQEWGECQWKQRSISSLWYIKRKTTMAEKHQQILALFEGLPYFDITVKTFA